MPPEAGREQARRRLDDYQQRLGARVVYNSETGAYDLRRQTLNVRTDFFVPVSRADDGSIHGGDVKLLAADNAQLARIDDVEYLHRQLLCALRLPAALLGFERDVNARATLAQQYAELARAIRRAQGMLAAGYRQVFDLQLRLLGLDDALGRYRVLWPEVRLEDENARAEAGGYAPALRLSPRHPCGCPARRPPSARNPRSKPPSRAAALRRTSSARLASSRPVRGASCQPEAGSARRRSADERGPATP